MKRVGIILLAAAVGILSGCEGDNSRIVSENNNTTVTVAVRSGEKESWEAVTRKFFTENPEIRLSFIELGSEFEQYRLLTSALSSRNRAFDIMEIEDVLTDEFIEKGYVKALVKAPSVADNCIQTARSAFMRDGKWYAVPFQADIGMMLTQGSYDISRGLYAESGDVSEYAVSAPDLSDETDVTGVLMELVAYTGDAEKGIRLYKSIYRDSIQGKANIKLFKEGKIPTLRVWSSEVKKIQGAEEGRLV